MWRLHPERLDQPADAWEWLDTLSQAKHDVIKSLTIHIWNLPHLFEVKLEDKNDREYRSGGDIEENVEIEDNSQDEDREPGGAESDDDSEGDNDDDVNQEDDEENVWVLVAGKLDEHGYRYPRVRLVASHSLLAEPEKDWCREARRDVARMEAEIDKLRMMLT